MSYYAYLVGHVKPNQEERVKLLLGLAKGPAAKVKAEIEKCVKNVVPDSVYRQFQRHCLILFAKVGSRKLPLSPATNVMVNTLYCLPSTN